MPRLVYRCGPAVAILVLIVAGSAMAQDETERAREWSVNVELEAEMTPAEKVVVSDIRGSSPRVLAQESVLTISSCESVGLRVCRPFISTPSGDHITTLSRIFRSE